MPELNRYIYFHKSPKSRVNFSPYSRIMILENIMKTADFRETAKPNFTGAGGKKISFPPSPNDFQRRQW